MAAPKGITNDEIITVIANPTYKTDTARAKALGISRNTYYDHLRRKPELAEQASVIRRAIIQANLTPIYHALFKKARAGDVAAINTLLKWAGELIDRSEGKTKIEGEVKLNLEAEISDADARRIATALLARREKK